MLEALLLEDVLLHVVDPLNGDKEKKVKMLNKIRSEQCSCSQPAQGSDSSAIFLALLRLCAFPACKAPVSCLHNLRNKGLMPFAQFCPQFAFLKWQGLFLNFGT